MSTGISNDERLLALFEPTPRLPFAEIIKRAGMNRSALNLTITRLLDKGILRKQRVRIDGGKTSITYFELRKRT
jgi:DNA-binding Lrp family transcriptional regulator